YRLLILTRRRHGLLPQPFDWFREMAVCLGDRMKIRLAYKSGKAISSIITLNFKGTMVYKYGCSDDQYHNLGGMQMLFWKAIREAIEGGLAQFDFGRSDLENQGLLTFKDRWGAARSSLTYWTTPPISLSSQRFGDHPFAGRIFANLPDR